MQIEFVKSFSRGGKWLVIHDEYSLIFNLQIYFKQLTNCNDQLVHQTEDDDFLNKYKWNNE